MAFSSSFLIFFGLLSLELVSFFQFSVCFDLLSNSLSFPSSSFSEWHSLASRFNPEALTAVSAHLENDIQQVERKGKWKQLNTRNAQPSRPNGEEKVNLVVGVKHEDDKQKALDLLFQLVSDPRNAAPLNGVSLSISDGHSYAISRGVLSISTFVDDLFVMNSFPTLFPRFYGQHLSKAETDFLLTPKKEKIMAVENWLHSGGVDIQSACNRVSDARDYYSCQLTVHQYLKLIPFADFRYYSLNRDSSVRILKSFPSQPHLLLHHTEFSNPSSAALRTTDAIHFLSGSSRLPPNLRTKPGVHAPSQENSLLEDYRTIGKPTSMKKVLEEVKKRNMEVEASVESGFQALKAVENNAVSQMVPTPFSADDAYLFVESDNKWLRLVRVQLVCPSGYTLNITNTNPSSPYHQASSTSTEQVTCVGTGGAAYSFVHVSASFSYQLFNVSSNSTQTITQNINVPAPTWRADPGNPLIAYTNFSSMFLPFNYIPYLLHVNVIYQNLQTANTISKLYSSTRPTTPQQILDVNMIKSWYRWAETLVNSGNASSYWPQAIGSFYLSTVNPGYFSPADLAQFLSANGLNGIGDAALVQYIPYSSADVNDPTQPDGETELDTQWMQGIGAGIPTQVIHYKWSNTDQGLANVLQQLQNTNDSLLPTVLSISYGETELDVFNNTEYDSCNTLFQSLSLRGISIFVSSGDNGAYETWNEDAPGTFNCSDGFLASWPASSPYITSVGATQLAASQLILQANGNYSYAPTEVVCSNARAALITSGGGFSSLYSQPSWQNASVQTYLSTCPQPPASMFNPNGRAFPDISLFGRAYHTVLSGDNSWSDGTSASSPSFAAFISNVNQQRKAVGLKPLGFLNPILYQLAAQHPEAFNDITIGDISCAGFDAAAAKTVCCPTGYVACPGYDAATGIGSPRWDVLGPLLVPTANANIFTYAGGYASFDGCDSSCFPATAAATTPAPTPTSDYVVETHPIQGWEIALIVVLTFGLGIFLAYWCCANFNRPKENRTQGEHIQLSA